MYNIIASWFTRGHSQRTSPMWGEGVRKKVTWGGMGGGGGHEKGTSPLYMEKYTIFSVKKRKIYA